MTSTWGLGHLRLRGQQLVLASSRNPTSTRTRHLATQAIHIVPQRSGNLQRSRTNGVGLFRLTDLESASARHMHVIDVHASVDRERSRYCLPVRPAVAASRTPDTALVSLLDDAKAAQKLMFEQRNVPISDLAHTLGKKPASFARLVRLNYLAPDIVAGLLSGEQPEGLTRKKLMQVDLPTDWALQRRLLGFPTPPEAQLRARSLLRD